MKRNLAVGTDFSSKGKGIIRRASMWAFALLAVMSAAGCEGYYAAYPGYGPYYGPYYPAGVAVTVYDRPYYRGPGYWYRGVYYVWKPGHWAWRRGVGCGFQATTWFADTRVWSLCRPRTAPRARAPLTQSAGQGPTAQGGNALPLPGNPDRSARSGEN